MTQLRVSATQIGVWKDCQRRWGYEYLDGIKPPPGPSAQLGSDIHSDLEVIVNTGVLPSTKSKRGRIANQGAALALELHRKGAKVEHKFDFEFGGVVYGGFIDAHHYEDGELLIVDWKTSSDPEKWGLTDETIRTNTQAVIYSMWGVTQYPVDRVHLHWHYLNTRAAVEAKPAQAILAKSEIASKFAELAHAPACEISKARSVAATELPQNFASCGKYGGCPHIERCHGTATPQERLKSLMSQALRAPGHIPKSLTTPDKDSKMSLLAMLEEEEAAPETKVASNDPVPARSITDPVPTAEMPPEPAPTDAGADAQAAAYEAAGQKLPPKRGRGRPPGAKNKPKITGGRIEREIASEASKPDEGPCEVGLDVEDPRLPPTKLLDEAIEHCLKQIKLATDGSDAQSWALAYINLTARPY